MPTHAMQWTETGIEEVGVSVVEGQLTSAKQPATGALLAAAEAITVAEGYRGEVSLAARMWVTELASRLERGAMFLIDYGLPRHELYHPHRSGGTVRCHYRHRVHEDPFWYPGLSDITSHVDFTAVADAAFEAGLDVLGYTSQANFLMNCGIGELLTSKVGAGDTAPVDAVKAQGAVNLLLSPNEMGELFKVVALGRGMKPPLLGFTRSDRLHAL